MDSLITLASGALLLSFLHALIPNHWVPFIVLGRERRWATGHTVFVTFLGGLAHLASTILVGVAIGVLGLALQQWFETLVRWVGPALLVAVGAWVFFRGYHSHAHRLDLPSAAGNGHDHEDTDHAHVHGESGRASGDWAVLLALCVMMFFSPCLEMELYYVIAARQGWTGIAMVSAIYLVVAVGVMMSIVALAAKRLERLHSPFFERHERKFSGGLLIVLGLVWLLFPF